jgi:transposase-like protein
MLYLANVLQKMVMCLIDCSKWGYTTEKLQEGKVMITAVLKCPFCESEDVRPYGASNGKKRYACNNPACSHKTFGRGRKMLFAR